MIALVLALALALQQPGAGESPLDVNTRVVSSQLRCPVCQGLSLQDSPSTLAQEMRDVVRSQLASGRSPEQVKDYFVEKYGEWILLEPEPRGLNLALYILPVVVAIGGAIFVVITARRWSRRGPVAVGVEEYEEL